MREAGVSISDIDDCTPGHLCEICNQPAITAIEWEDDYGKRWSAYCEACATKELVPYQIILA
jgi:hypothetical protein